LEGTYNDRLVQPMTVMTNLGLTKLKDVIKGIV